MLDEFAFMRRTKDQIIIFYVHILEIFPAKCLILLTCISCLPGLGCNIMLTVKFNKKIALFL